LSVCRGFELVFAGIHCDPIKPCGKTGFEPEFLKPSIDLYEGLLCRIVRFLVIAKYPVAQIEQSIFVVEHQFVECSLVSLLEGPDQCSILRWPAHRLSDIFIHPV